ncbi:energy transducer TonB [Dyadobacter sp. LJ53]|uniref:energy transducer TonB n=1 Tax=Dyadobacter chenwenxiniae TaxID=2906456 RepID=UPI001F2A188C|nr:energy transducer TonB [Dyadobacter chenwenxiniae]MCF0052638.1 energy transducer TonB [Dyadobacter chenwenxiniae]
MKKLLFYLVLLPTITFAQQVYQIHEVQQKAAPSGGDAYLEQFINANMQVPFESTVKGVNGRVYLKGIIEPNGHISHVEVARGLNPLCDQEAVRVISMYNAWKPAEQNGLKVRQAIIVPVTFKTGPLNTYDSTQTALIGYFDSKNAPTTDPKKYEYRSITPVDARGYVKGDVIYEERSGKKWNKVGTATFFRERFWYKPALAGSDSVQAIRIGARDENGASHATELVQHSNGQLLAYTEFGAFSRATLEKTYDLQGMVRSAKISGDSVNSYIRWFANGQIASIWDETTRTPPNVELITLINSWDSTGNQQLREGQGYWKSFNITPQGKWFLEQGAVSRGLKQGKWIGKWADSTVYYEEVYESGILKNGFAIEDGQRVEYETAKSNPQFKGGVKEMYKFLGMNIKFPSLASRARVSGQVRISFTVCEDGSVCDYKVEQGLGFGTEDEAMRAVKMMSGHWEPGTMRGKPVRVRCQVPINFQSI